MSAKVYSLPEGIEYPEFESFLGDQGGFDSEAYFAALEDCKRKTAEWCRANSDSTRLRGNVVGKTFAVGVADGRATYMVYEHSPLSLILLPGVDDYRADPIFERGLNVQTVKRLVKQDETLSSIFGKSNRDA